jgi:hypothetical protein
VAIAKEDGLRRAQKASERQAWLYGFEWPERQEVELQALQAVDSCIINGDLVLVLDGRYVSASTVSLARLQAIARHEWPMQNRCCRCLRKGRVGVTETNAGVPICWQCCTCGRFVCIECTLTVPGSTPPEFYDDTYCSEGCRNGEPPEPCEADCEFPGCFVAGCVKGAGPVDG